MRLTAGSALIAAIPFLLWLPLSEAGAAAALLLCYTLAPLLCFVLPMRAAKRGIDRYLAFFPPPAGYTAAWLILRLTPPPITLPLCFLLAVLGSNWGKERYRRKGAEKSQLQRPHA